MIYAFKIVSNDINSSGLIVSDGIVDAIEDMMDFSQGDIEEINLRQIGDGNMIFFDDIREIIQQEENHA